MEIMVGLISGAGGLLLGLIIGFYEARDRLTKKLSDYVTREEYANCTAKATMKEVVQRLDKGVEQFEEVRTNIALIKQHLQMQ
jgi:hypothetical protein